ncbi:hypothetical protein PoB_006689100 [Plakobranchus ocellatus]|uniref:Transposase DDE domain-containing protein n=1 Tax=Plakobranchus ocellatus TaxID=259542 RepID=A0AAV4D8L1_9GAST|nr:hypothetical protein PoB_006689100 [Plakobranchus ocellatus]
MTRKAIANYLTMAYAKNNQDSSPGFPMLGLLAIRDCLIQLLYALIAKVKIQALHARQSLLNLKRTFNRSLSMLVKDKISEITKRCRLTASVGQYLNTLLGGLTASA